LSEVYAALTWTGAQPPCTPAEAASAVVRLIEPPSAIEVLPDGPEVAVLHLRLAATHQLTARRIHDARHAATALQHGVTEVFTYDAADWAIFAAEGVAISGPPSILSR
jgi:predicted nucleic acid-binding protein